MTNNGINERIRINFKVRSTNKKSSQNPGFDEAFELINSDDSNIFYRFQSNNQLLLEGVNAKLVEMPIPPGFKTKDKKDINVSEDALLIPLVINIHPGIASSNSEKHFCQGFPDNNGTACSQLMQRVPNTDITYFTTENTDFPEIKGNPILNKMLKDYEAKNKNLFFLPTITPNKTVIYMVFNKKKDLTEFLEKHDPNPEFEFGIALNGWIIYIDQWECSVFLYNNTVAIGDLKIYSKATLHKFKA